MAIRYAISSSTWSNLNTWNGGTLPTSSDDVYADGKTVTIDQDIDILSLNNTQRVGGTIGGYFTIDDSHNIIAPNIVASNTYCILATHIGGKVVNITGNLFAGTSSSWACGIQHNGSGVINIYGTLKGGTANVAIGAYNASIGTINVVGNVTGGTYSNGYALYNHSTGIINLTGQVFTTAGMSVYQDTTGTINIYGNQYNNGANYSVQNTVGIVNIYGNVYGSTSISVSSQPFLLQNGAGASYIFGNVYAQDDAITTTIGQVQNGSAGLLVISGSVLGGSISNSIAVSNASTGIVEIYGNISGGTNATNAPAIYSQTAGQIRVYGNVTAGAHPAISSINMAGKVYVTGNLIAVNSINPVLSPTLIINSVAPQIIDLQTNSSNTVHFQMSNAAAGQPLESDVRYGTVYGALNEFTGSCYVPSAITVSIGVPVDNTVGTLSLFPSDFWNYAQSGITSGIGARIKNCSTVDSVGGQLVSFS